MSPTPFTTFQLDALRELANIGSGTAGTALSQMLGRSVDISVPAAAALTFADAIDTIGPPEEEVTGVVLGVVGEMEGIVLLLMRVADAAGLCNLLGVDADSEMGQSALGEIGNIVGTSYINALAQMTGLNIEPSPPQAATDMLGAIVSSVLAGVAGAEDVALVLDSDLEVEGEDCSLSFLMLPTRDGVEELLGRLGLGS
jgi:chemotaxis protein CheC